MSKDEEAIGRLILRGQRFRVLWKEELIKSMTLRQQIADLENQAARSRDHIIELTRRSKSYRVEIAALEGEIRNLNRRLENERCSCGHACGNSPDTGPEPLRDADQSAALEPAPSGSSSCHQPDSGDSDSDATDYRHGGEVTGARI